MNNISEGAIFTISVYDQPPYVMVEVDPKKKDWKGDENELISVLLDLTKEWLGEHRNAKTSN